MIISEFNMSRVTVLLLFLSLKSYICKESNQIYHVALNGDGSVNYNWMLNYPSEEVTVEIHLPTNFGWFAIGFSDRGDQSPGDYCILWKNLKKKTFLEDTWVDESGVVHLDQKQNCEHFKIITRDEVTKFTYKRKFDTCDDEDYLIEEGTTHIVWARGKTHPYKINGLNITTDNIEDRGMVRVQLLKNIEQKSELPSHVRTLDIFANDVHVPAEETTYWCHVHKLEAEFRKKHHVYRVNLQNLSRGKEGQGVVYISYLQYESHIPKTSEGLVHHMEVFHCVAPVDEEIPLYVGNCFAKDRPQATQVCKRVLGAWAMGAPPLTYPEEAGLPLGGENFNPYLMLEVHYNNPELKSGVVDSSGIRFHVSSRLKSMDAGVMELGLEYTDKMAIPPKQQVFSLTGYCVTECTSVSLPPEGIVIFASQLHTHLTGTKINTRHVRDGVELRELNRDNHFSTHFQEIRILKKPVTVLPGDALITRCDYNTVIRDNITLGGFSITDEMCVNYVHYFPATDLEVCKSAISDQALRTYFDYMRNWEGQPTSADGGVSDNYKSIDWNKMRVQLLDDVYRESPLSMQCNMSSGDRFPGYWENTPVSQISKPLPPPPRFCKK